MFVFPALSAGSYRSDRHDEMFLGKPVEYTHGGSSPLRDEGLVRTRLSCIDRLDDPEVKHPAMWAVRCTAKDQGA
jgi:hypothetical protein